MAEMNDNQKLVCVVLLTFLFSFDKQLEQQKRNSFALDPLFNFI